ncbi:unnamed protein product [Nippostrongylus brasiliensis]|uniref:Regulatory protein zeste n=1 Tax=Nippostrongylus brasiliensis TaxID=27835 RepID=A0A158R1M2_NIPBR|nr:unnamed protein product [Nippostrongylus brasiliensis]
MDEAGDARGFLADGFHRNQNNLEAALCRNLISNAFHQSNMISYRYEDQKTEVWSRILAECTARGHHWVKGKDVTYLKKSKWPGIKRDAIEHYQADMKSDVSHRKKLTEADVIVLKAISFDTENLGSLTEKDEIVCVPVTDVTQPVTVEVKAGEPLDLLAACGMQLNGDSENFDNGLLVNLFSKNQQEPRNSTSYQVRTFPAEQEHRYSKRQRVDDDGPIDHDLMAALGFGKNRSRSDLFKLQTEVQTSGGNTYSKNTDDRCYSGGHQNAVDSTSRLSQGSMSSSTERTIIKQIKVEPSYQDLPMERGSTAPERVTTIGDENGRDLKALQKRAYEAQIAREEAMTKYYLMKVKKLELEIAQLERNGLS